MAKKKTALPPDVESVFFGGNTPTQAEEERTVERSNGRTKKRTVKNRTEMEKVEGDYTTLNKYNNGEIQTKRKTERYSFEIYSDQKEQLEDIIYNIKKKTGNRVSASALIREAIDLYFKGITI
jgi:hypothetical protein